MKLQTVLDALEHGKNTSMITGYYDEAITIVRQMMQAEPVGYVDGDDMSRRILWAPNSAAFDLPVGTKIYAAPQAVSGWLPISSAPKDGTMFDGWNGERVVDVTWAHPSYSATGHRAWCVTANTRIGTA